MRTNMIAATGGCGFQRVSSGGLETKRRKNKMGGVNRVKPAILFAESAGMTMPIGNADCGRSVYICSACSAVDPWPSSADTHTDCESTSEHEYSSICI